MSGAEKWVGAVLVLGPLLACRSHLPLVSRGLPSVHMKHLFVSLNLLFYKIASHIGLGPTLNTPFNVITSKCPISNTLIHAGSGIRNSPYEYRETQFSPKGGKSNKNSRESEAQ